MAAASSSPDYDVFLSFRGEDTRQNFISHLYGALCRANIRVFLDDKEIKKGNKLSTTFRRAIENSNISVVTFSENYACSSWCLNELVKIMKCKDRRGQIVLPIFYKVAPSDVRNQRKKYQIASAEHENHNQSKVKKWKAALHKAANLAGWDSTKRRSDFELVEVIVEDVLQKLNYITEPLVPSGLVGIDKQIAEVESLLFNVRSDDVRMVGLYGMGGIGKTTIAETLFRKHYSQFEGHCFLQNVSEICKQMGVNIVLNTLQTAILGSQYPKITSNYLVVDGVRQRKVLVVIDDVSDSQQLEYLVRNKELYGPGSKIIVTTRDKGVLHDECDGLYNVRLLDNDKAHQLFCLSAFKQDRPKSEFIYLTEKVLDYAEGHPLALKVLGSFLYSKNTREWESALQKLKRSPHEGVLKVLRLSYDGLDFEEKNILLDVSNGLKGEKKWRAVRLLDACDFFPDIGMRTLQDKSLMTVQKDQTIWMHNLIQEMGRQIVREESMKRPEKRSRLCDSEDIYNAFSHLKVIDQSVELECISLNMSEIKKISIDPTAFAKMPFLRFLKFYLPGGEGRSNVHIPKGIEELPAGLRYLRWDIFQGKALPATFNAENLVELDLRQSLIEKLWDGEKDLANLKSLNLCGCKRLSELPDLSTAANLEELHLDFCTSLREVRWYDLSLDHLLALNLEGCTELQSIKGNIHFKSLRWFNLRGCSKLVEFSVASEKVEYLSLEGAAIEEFPSSVWQNKNLSCFYLSGCLGLKKLPPIIGTSLSITSLFLNGCSNLSELPDNLNLLAALNTLSVQGSFIETLPATIKHLSQLRSLDVSHCKRLRSLPELPLLLQHLNARGCTSLKTVSSSAATTLMQNSFGSQSWKFLLRKHQELKTSLHQSHFSDMFEFNHCRGLDVNAHKIIVVEAIIRIKYAAYLSSLAQTDADPYHQFQLFSKDSNAEPLESICRQLCVRPLGGDVPDWNLLRDVESSSMIIKLNANCCSHCKRSSFAFGLFQTNEEEDTHLSFGGRHRICVEQLVESPMRSFEKLWYNDVRVCFPGSRVPREFRHQTRDQTCITIELPRSSDLLGFAFCIISSNCPSTDQECFPMIRCECYLDDAECTRKYQSDYFYHCELEWKLISGSVFLWYDVKTSNRILEAIKERSDTDQSTTYNPRLSFQFYSNSGIKECGVWPIYASDLESQRLELERSKPCPASSEQQLPTEKNQDKLQAFHRAKKLKRNNKNSAHLEMQIAVCGHHNESNSKSLNEQQQQLPRRNKSKRSLDIEELEQSKSATEDQDELQQLDPTKKLKKR